MISFLKKIFSPFYNYWIPPTGNIDLLIKTQIVNRYNKVFFICIGANNGKIDDPIYKYVKEDNWRGCYIEPQKSVFENHLIPEFGGNSNIKLENAAISNTIEKRILYKLNFGDSDWVTALASFEKNNVQKHLDHGWVFQRAREQNLDFPTNSNDWILEEIVESITLDYLIDKYEFNHIHILVIDTEGYDFEILKQIDFTKIKPDLLVYEYRHLSKRDFKKSVQLLKSKGYNLRKDKGDVIAYLN